MAILVDVSEKELRNAVESVHPFEFDHTFSDFVIYSRITGKKM